MKIGIDISQIVYQGTGVATYTKNLVENLLKVDKKNSYILFFSSLRGQDKKLVLGREDKKTKIKSYHFPPLVLSFIWNKLHILPVEYLIGKVDVFHSSDWIEPPAKGKKVTTIHDLTVFKYPETLHPKIVQTQKQRLSWVKKESDLIICVSKSTQKDVINFLGINKKRTRVVYEGRREEYERLRKKSKEEIKKEVARVKRKYGIKGGYILSVGVREPRKNLERLIASFNSLKGKFDNIELLIAGKYGWGNNGCLLGNKKDGVKYLGYVASEELGVLYREAKLFVYPSLYEGFGLPVLDALSMGCLVVTSNRSSLPEVAGEAAIYCQPEKVSSIARAIEKGLMIKKIEKRKLIKKGLRQAKKFSWKKAAWETLRAYEEVCR